ncbi:MAG TPA: Wzz/FepE/Etk N-terminal domain-containing protein, partial [Kribbella sp.]|nr:Wzz/FepE/Etk N-terminal domain-containing protein [Kribbella sp.]
MKATTIDQGRFEPTVFGAMRRYRVMVLIISFLVAAAAVTYSLVQPEVYRASATVTVPQGASAPSEARDQYFDSQVLLLQSQEVADRAARIANTALNGAILSPEDFSGQASALLITPPEHATPGSFGSSIVAISFSWPGAMVAQAGVNAALQAFDEVRYAQIAAQGAASVAAVDRAIRDPRTKGQQADLLKQRAETLSELQEDLATHPTIGWAPEPQVPTNGNSKRSGAIGLLAGLALAAGLAYARARRHRSVEDADDPAAIYDAPLIGDIPPTRNGIIPGRMEATDPLPVARDPDSAAAEAFRFTAGSVERIRAGRDHHLVVAFVSAGSESDRSTVVANIALAVAESGTPVLAVDADTGAGDLTGLLLPGSRPTDGFGQVVSGRCAVSDCVEASPLNSGVAVLPVGYARARQPCGVPYPEAVAKLIAEAKGSFDLVLIDSPGLLNAATAVDLVHDSDAAVLVLGPGESVDDHVTIADRLDQVDSDVVGYVYRRERRWQRLVRRLWKPTAFRAGRQAERTSDPHFAFGPTGDR